MRIVPRVFWLERLMKQTLMRQVFEGPALISWEDAYKINPPWDIGRPQPAFVEVVRKGELKKSTTLDVGCGTGENALFLAENGFSAVGVDLSARAIEAAKAKASERKLNVDFRVANALALDFDSSSFDNVIDSGLFHTFNDMERIAFASAISRVLTANGGYFMLCFSDKEPTNWGGPRRVTKAEIEATFSPFFNVNYIRDDYFATRIHNNGGRAYLTFATKRST
jgi:SAM-dependent methyltransferase